MTFCFALYFVFSLRRKAAEEARESLEEEMTRARLALSTLVAEKSLLEEQVTTAASKVG